MRDMNKFKGCLIGGAVGDALGYAVEFSSASQIFKNYGENGITDYKLVNGVAKISDDTQMTLFTAMGLLVGTTMEMTQNKREDYVEYHIANAYKDWFLTQTKDYPVLKKEVNSWLMNIPELFSMRAPGNTCMFALKRGGHGVFKRPLNNSKGCGGIMRVAPVGLYFVDRKYGLQDIDIMGAKAAVLTHGHEMGYIPAAMLVHIIYRIVRYSESILDAVKDAMFEMPRIFSNSKYMSDFLMLIEKSLILVNSDLDDLSAIKELGQGWVADETLAIALYCALKYSDNFEKGIIAAVNHDGDSDSTGAVTGNILGASLGFDKIPKQFLENLELKDVILEVAEDLCKDCRVNEYGLCDDVWRKKYITIDYKY